MINSNVDISTKLSFEKWMKIAFVEARIAKDIFEVPIGAIFVLHPVLNGEINFEEGEVIAKGYNTTVVNKNV
jgi:hypothetical protein